MVNRKGKWFQVGISSIAGSYEGFGDGGFVRVTNRCKWIEVETNGTVQCIQGVKTSGFSLYRQERNTMAPNCSRVYYVNVALFERGRLAVLHCQFPLNKRSYFLSACSVRLYVGILYPIDHNPAGSVVRSRGCTCHASNTTTSHDPYSFVLIHPLTAPYSVRSNP